MVVLFVLCMSAKVNKLFNIISWRYNLSLYVDVQVSLSLAMRLLVEKKSIILAAHVKSFMLLQVLILLYMVSLSKHHFWEVSTYIEVHVDVYF